MVLDGGWLKDLCGGVEMSTSKKHGHQIHFETTFHTFLISNSEGALMTTPNEPGLRAKRVGWRMMNRFADEGDSSISGATVFAAEHQRASTHKRWSLRSPFRRRPPCGVRGMDYYVGLYEVYTPTRGEDGVGMQVIYEQLKGSHNLDIEAEAFFDSQF